MIMEDPAKDLRSCLRKTARVKKTDLQTGGKKSVKFNIQEEQLKWIYEKDKDPKLASRKWKNKQFNSNNSRFNYALHSLGDVTKIEYFNALRALRRKRILINLQFSVTREHIEYFWTIKWNEDELTNEEIELQRFREQFEVLFGDTVMTDPHQIPRIIVLFVTPGTNALPKIDLSEHDRLMIVGHLGLISNLSHEELDSLYFVNFILTAHDIIRSGPYHSDFVEEVLDACHGWPILAQKFLECERKQIEWIEAEADLYPYKSDKIIADLYMLLKICELTRQDVTKVSFMNIGFTEWAKICGAIIIQREVHELVAPPEIGPELLALKGINPTEFDERVNAAKSPNDLLVLCPPQLSKALDKDFPELMEADDEPDGSFSWLAMQRFITKNMITNKCNQTFSEKFSFMKDSWIGHLTHTISSNFVVLSPVDMNPRKFRRLEDWPRSEVLDFTLIHTWYFPALMWEIPTMCVYISVHKSESPDWFIKLENTEDPTTQHLLCLFLEVDEDLSIQQLVDKLWQKCPYLIVAYYCRIANETRLEFNNKDGAVSLKMTAIIGSICHKRLEQELQERMNVPVVNGAIRCTHTELACLPNDFELIVLLDEGLNELLGSSHIYDTLKNFKPIYLNN